MNKVLFTAFALATVVAAPKQASAQFEHYNQLVDERNSYYDHYDQYHGFLSREINNYNRVAQGLQSGQIPVSEYDVAYVNARMTQWSTGLDRHTQYLEQVSTVIDNYDRQLDRSLVTGNHSYQPTSPDIIDRAWGLKPWTNSVGVASSNDGYSTPASRSNGLTSVLDDFANRHVQTPSVEPTSRASTRAESLGW